MAVTAAQAAASTETGADQTTAAQRSAESLAAFWRPRYWSTWLLLAWLRITAALPLRVAIKLHKGLGRLLWYLAPRRRHIVVRNLEICFPALSRVKLEAISKNHLANVGACLAEIAIAWFSSSAKLAALFRIEGSEHLMRALAPGKGVILLSGHFTSLEICVPAVKFLVPHFAFMYRPRHNALLDAMQTRCRKRAAHVSLVNSDIRTMLNVLRENAVTWYAPDQYPAGSRGTVLPFFGNAALTSTATSRIARITGATVVPFFFCRLPDDSGYVLRFDPPVPNFPSADPIADTLELTSILEGFVRECPEQYFWIHRKFRNRDCASDVYRH